MKIINIKAISLLLISVIIISSCKKTEIERLNFTGSIKGLAYAYKEDEAYKVEGGVSVKLEGTDFSAVSDADGKYTINNIPSGTYNIIYSKESFSVMKECGTQILGNSEYPVTIEPEYLAEPSSTVASNLSISFEDGRIIFSADLSPASVDTFKRSFYVLISDKPEVSFDNNTDWFRNWFTGTGSSLSFSRSLDEFSKYNPNKTYYAIAYGWTTQHWRPIHKYFDPQKASYVYTGLNETPTNVVNFKISAKK